MRCVKRRWANTLRMSDLIFLCLSHVTTGFPLSRGYCSMVFAKATAVAAKVKRKDSRKTLLSTKSWGSFFSSHNTHRKSKNWGFGHRMWMKLLNIFDAFSCEISRVAGTRKTWSKEDHANSDQRSKQGHVWRMEWRSGALFGSFWIFLVSV